MTTIEQQERELYSELWAGVSAYGDYSPGAELADLFVSLVAPIERRPTPTVLDAGCGSGKGGLELQAHGFDVTLCDITDAGLTPEARRLRFAPACLWKDIRTQVPYGHGGKFDYVYCCDVLEHIPPEYTMLVIDQLLRVTRLGAFLNISLQPDVFGAFVGKALHQSVFPFTWWRDRLSEMAALIECRDLLSSGVYFVRPLR